MPSSSPDNNSHSKEEDGSKSSISFFEKVTEMFDSVMSTKNKLMKQTSDIINCTKSQLDKLSPDKVKQRVAQASASLNNKFPYFSMLCRTHDQEIKYLPTIFVAYQTRKMGRRIFFVSTLSVYLLSSVTIYLAQYKWLSIESSSEDKK